MPPCCDKSGDSGQTGLLIVDPYNDFMSEGGKLFDAIEPTADQTGLFNNLRGIIPAARATGIQVFIVPQHRLLEGDFDGWQHVNMFQKAGLPTRAFAVGTWGASSMVCTFGRATLFAEVLMLVPFGRAYG